MNRIILAFLLICIWSPIFSQVFSAGTIPHDGITRNYLLDVPTTYNPSTPIPLVLNLHGATSNAGQQRFYTQMELTAEANGFIVVHPNGVNSFWNVGFDIAGVDADDVGFLSALIDTLSNQYNIDPDRVFSCGMSLGGFMSYRLACELENRIAAIASVTGSMANGIIPGCQNERPVPVLQMHGTNDDVVPINGSDIYPSIDSVINLWIGRNSCIDPPTTEQLPDLVLNDNSTVTKYLYTDCAESSEIEYYEVLGGEHTWPGAWFDIGVTNKDIEANDLIWDFFLRHPHPRTSTSIETQRNQNSISLFPNPVGDKLYLKGLIEDNYLVQITNSLGQTIFKDQRFLSETISEILIPYSIPRGIYYLNLQNASSTVSLPFIKR